MKIKICGMRDAENIRALSEFHPDYMGFIFYPVSKRYAGDMDADAVAQIPGTIKKTGVFVNGSLQVITDTADSYKLQAVQLHGNEEPEICRQLSAHGLEVIKAFGIDDTFNFNTLERYVGAADYFLFDTKTSGYGGSGRMFDWSILDNYKLDLPYFLSGGLNPGNISKLAEINDDRFYAADLNSGFEISPAMKNITELRKAINLLRL